MAVRDPYEVLGVARSASADEIKSAYRRLARQHHPDVNPNDPTAEEKFKEIGSAYSVLSDPEKRARFDQFGTTEDGPGAGAGDFFNGGGGIGDIFDMFFGGAAGAQSGRRRTGRDGEDVQTSATITLQEVLTGVKKEVNFDTYARCSSCRGTGVEGGGAPETCTGCKGAGAVTTVRSTFIGQVRTQTVCPTCRGEGTTTSNPCKKCRGQKLERQRKTMSVDVPPGVDNGATMQIPGAGSEGVGTGRPGDLFISLEVENDPRFERRGTHLFTVLDLTFAQAALGDKVKIEGVDADIELEIKAGTQPGTPLTSRGAGLPPLHGGRRGDLTVQVNVLIPTKLTEPEAKLIRELAELRGENMPHGAEPGGFFHNLFGWKK